jgi:hypothetical protein
MRHDIILMVGKSLLKLIPKRIELLWRNADPHHGSRTLPLMLAKIAAQESNRVQGIPVA